MTYSNERLLKFLSLSNKKLKLLKSKIKNVRIQRNKHLSKLNEIERYLNYIYNYYDEYDFPSYREFYKLQGKLDLKKDILEILNKK